MSKVTQIEDALRALDPAGFQRLCAAYLHRRGYERVNLIGTVAATNRIARGTPDLFVPVADGRYVFSEQTTQQTDVADKLLRDLNKCLDPEKTGVPVDRIREFVGCHTSVLDPDEEHMLVEAGRAHGVLVTLLGLGPIAYDLAHSYPDIARDYLGVTVDTDQIVTLDRFVHLYGRNPVATPLDTPILHRDAAIERALSAVGSEPVLILTGPPGVGKSRLAVEVARCLGHTDPTARVFAIHVRGANLFEDLRVHTRAPGRYVIVVDDANRVSGFDYVLQLLHDSGADRHFTVIATARDYAVDRLTDQIRDYSRGTVLRVNPLSDDHIADIARGLGVKNSEYLQRITHIARGNPRLAVMAARLAIETNTLGSLRDVSALYEEYFRSVRRDIEQLSDPEVLRAAGIVALFRHVDRKNEKQMALLDRVFGIDPGRFWAAVRLLHDAEVADLYEDEIVKVSDQVLATFLFYLAFFKDRILDDAALLHPEIFPQHRQRLIDALNPVAQAFDAELIAERLRAVIRRRLADLRGEQSAIVELLGAFGSLVPTETLSFVRDYVAALAGEPLPSVEEITFKPGHGDRMSPWSLLARFADAPLSDARIALTLAADLLAKKPLQAPYALALFRDDFGLGRDSHRRDYEIERATLDMLWERARRTDEMAALFLRVFLEVAGPLVQTEHRSHESLSDAVQIYSWHSPDTPSVRALRDAVWTRITALLADPRTRDSAIHFIRHYSQRSPHVAEPVHIAADARLIVPALAANLDPATTAHAALVHVYLRLLEHRGVPLDGDAIHLRDRFASATSRLARLLLEEFDNPRDGLTWEEQERRRAQRLSEVVGEYSQAEFDRLVTDCLGAREYLVPEDDAQRRNDWFYKQQVASIWTLMAERGHDALTAWTMAYLARGNPLRLEPHGIVIVLVRALGPAAAWELLSHSEYALKQSWLGAFFACLPTESVTPEQVEALYRFYESTPAEALYTGMSYLSNYERVDPRVVQRVFAILVGRSAVDARCAFPLASGVEGQGDLGPRLQDLFGRSAEDRELLKRAYLAAAQVAPHYDYHADTFNLLLDFDPNFGAEWVDAIVEKTKNAGHPDKDGHREYASLWLRDDYAAVMRAMLARVHEHEREHYSLESLAGSYLRAREPEEKHPDTTIIHAHQDALLADWIREAATDREELEFVFSMVSRFAPHRRRELVRVFLEANKDPAAFQALDLEPRFWTFRGSEVPTLQKRLDFYESLLPLFNEIGFLPHREAVERMIAALREQIADERRRDFLEH